MTLDHHRSINPCGGTDHRPRRPDNRAGQSEIAYRITTHAESLARMAWQLPRQDVTDAETGEILYPLQALRTRSLADPTISLMDAFAFAEDVLAFYSERIANEGYLATATQRRSILELAAMIGYKLAPGVAASTHLAFTVETADDPYRQVQVDRGVQAMSIPQRKGELPQIYETVEDITARAEWNEMHARTEAPQNLALFMAGTGEEAEPVDARDGTLYMFDLDGSFDETVLADPEHEEITTDADLVPFHPLDESLDLVDALANRRLDAADNDDISASLNAIPVDEIYLRGVGLNLRLGTRLLIVGQAVGDRKSVV